jgi:hypothetical protein
MSHPFVLMTLQPPIPTTLIVPTQQTLEIRLYCSIIAGRGHDISRPIPQEESRSHLPSHLHIRLPQPFLSPPLSHPLQVNPPLNTATAPSAGSTNSAKSHPWPNPPTTILSGLASRRTSSSTRPSTYCKLCEGPSLSSPSSQSE